MKNYYAVKTNDGYYTTRETISLELTVDCVWTSKGALSAKAKLESYKNISAKLVPVKIVFDTEVNNED